MALIELGAPDRNVVGVRTWQRSVTLDNANDEISIVIPRGAGHILALALSGVESMLPVVGTAAVPTGVDVLYTETSPATSWRLPGFTRIPARADLGKPSILVVRPDLQGVPTLPATVVVQIETAERGALDDAIADVVANYQPLAANLTALAALVGVADRLAYFTGAGALALATFGAAARAFLASFPTPTFAADVILSASVPPASPTVLSLNTALSYFWRNLGPVTRTYTAFGMGAAPPTRTLPTWGGVTCDYTTGTSTRGAGIFTPVDQTTWGARHRIRSEVVGQLSGQQCGNAGLRVSGGTDVYWWTINGSAETYNRWHEVAGTPTSTGLGATGPVGRWPDFEVFVPARASEATAATVTIKASVDGFTTSYAVDSLSVAPAGTGIGGANVTMLGTITAEAWSAA